MTVHDHEQRLKATDPRSSFIVQAPAGSGKTEILTQRYLRLLATVQEPEQIVALTFTRKAAHEMRERIVCALQQTAEGIKASSDHQKQTFGYAAKALARSKRFNWQLLDQPARLRIFTIDSLCHRISQAIPLQDTHVPFAKISEAPQQRYDEAAKACLDYAIHEPQFAPAIKQLLSHVDNRQDHLLALFTELLITRDQWLSILHQAKTQKKEQFEDALFWIEQHELNRLSQSIPKDCVQTLIDLARQVTEIESNPDSARYSLRHWERLDQFDRKLSAGLAALLLTTQNTLRKSFDHHVGLKRQCCDAEVFKRLKAQSQSLLEQLSAAPDFLTALIRAKKIPEPHYDKEQWAVLQALFSLLPLLAAHLQLVFTQHNEVDFTAITQQALDALGDAEAPTDLALYLDHQIHHLLVDEFQDTSIQQFQLLTQIVQGWQADDGKSLFVVGDPMQSIYRFRSAEVGLFLRARETGIGPVKLFPLELTCNFRSNATIVNWVNTQFQEIFPHHEDIESGAVSYHRARSIQPETPTSVVAAWQYEDAKAQAQALAERVQATLEDYPDDDLAILVRSRTHLPPIMRALKEAKIPFQGIEIDLLSKLPHIRDAFSLTQALLMPANRLAWLAFLRSPWVGLSLSDLHIIARYAPKQSIGLALSHLDKMPLLTEDGRTRAAYAYAVFQHASQHRQQSLTAWLLATLNLFHFKQILSVEEQDDLEQYWLLVDQHEHKGQISDWQRFKTELNQLYSKRVTPSRLKIMTIHKSKGLEFDTVILPGLSAKSNPPKSPLLRWLRLPTEDHELLLLSPIKAADHEQCLLYDYLGKLDSEKNQYEQQRLLYVAVTRARKRLYLMDSQSKSHEGAFRHLLKRQIFSDASPDRCDLLLTDELPKLRRLPAEAYQKLPSYAVPRTGHVRPMIPDPNHMRLIGIAVHELLQWICDHHPDELAQVPWALVKHRLTTLGFSGTAHQSALSTVHQSIQQIFNDPIGQWLIQAHQDEHNEYELLVQEDGEIATRIIDRTFLERGIRWIIDFKTGRLDEETLQSHRQQINAYARLMATRHSEPIHCGLYYLSNSHWESWIPFPA